MRFVISMTLLCLLGCSPETKGPGLLGPGAGGGDSGSFGKPGERFDIVSFNIPGFRAEREVDFNEYHRLSEGCNKNRTNQVGDEYREVNYSLRIQAGKSLKWSQSARKVITQVQGENFTYEETLLAVSVDGFNGFPFQSPRRACSYERQEMKSFLSCNPESQVTPEFRRFLEQNAPSTPAQLECTGTTSADRPQYSSFSVGRLTLPNGQEVEALVEKSQVVTDEKCSDGWSGQVTSSRAIARVPQLAGIYGLCAETYDLSIRDADGKYFESLNRIESAPAR